MRSRILPSLLLGLALAPALPVLAQDSEEDMEEEAEASETEGADIVDEPRQTGQLVIPKGQEGRESAPGETHTVETGDTLWDLSQKYLGSPWYWPKVWSYNPEIANPHWIYPGNLVRLFPAGEEVPQRVEADGGASEPSESDFSEPDDGESSVIVSGKIGYEPKAGGRSVMTQGFVTQRELDEAGRIDSSFSEAVMLSYPEQVYVRFKKRADAKLGDRYVVFRTTQPIIHPVNQKQVGYLSEFLGTLRVVAVGERLVTAQIMDTWSPVVRGDLVGPYGERLVENVVPRPNEKEVKAFVVTALVPYLTLIGEHHVLVVDKGSAAGVQPGNTFSIVRQANLGDMFNPQKVALADTNLPSETVGVCLVTEVKEHTSNCVLTQTLREVVPGDKAVMKVGSAPTAQR